MLKIVDKSLNNLSKTIFLDLMNFVYKNKVEKNTDYKQLSSQAFHRLFNLFLSVEQLFYPVSTIPITTTI